jgi:pyruvate,water dikinase
MLSHGAIVSREFGIPAIVGVEGAVSKLKDGDLVELNAFTGEITLIYE